MRNSNLNFLQGMIISFTSSPPLLSPQEYYESRVYEDGLIKQYEEHQEAIHMEDGESVNVVIAMPFLDVNPLGATE